MGKNKRKTIEFFDSIHQINVELDSIEERDFFHWVIEAIDLNIIKDFIYQPESFQLFDKAYYTNSKGKEKFLLREHIYSPDFKLIFNKDQSLLIDEFKVPQKDNNEDYSIYIDVKGTFNNTQRSFSLNQKWMWEKYQLYIYKLVPQDFFKKFGVPENCRFTEKTKKPSKKYEGYKSIKESFFA